MEPSGVERSLAAAERAVDDLLNDLAGADDTTLGILPTDGVLAVAVRLERLRNRLSATDHAVIADLDRRHAAEERMVRSTAHLLADTLRITVAEAKRRLAAVAVLAPQPLMTGGTQPPRYAVLSAAQRDGRLGAEQLRIMINGLDRVNALVGLRPDPEAEPVGPDDLARAERSLCDHARLFDARELSAIADRIVECLNPDGDPDRLEAHDRQRRAALRRMSNGMWRLTGDLVPEVGVALAAVFRPLSRPRPADPCADRLRGEDERTPEQRTHDALGEVALRLLRAGDLPEAGGTPATVIITVQEETLRAAAGQATASDGTRLSLDQALRIADQAQLLTVVRGASGAVLWEGRTKRIATTAQTYALYARDGGCSFPGCDHPPEWCERHHVISWLDGGRTDIDNLTLLCSYHHHRFAKHGWSCRMIDGLPHWTAPPRVDPDQVPQLNDRLRRRQPGEEMIGFGPGLGDRPDPPPAIVAKTARPKVVIEPPDRTRQRSSESMVASSG